MLVIENGLEVIFIKWCYCNESKKDADDPGKVYEMYYDFSEEVKRIKPHRVLAINRGEKRKGFKC